MECARKGRTLCVFAIGYARPCCFLWLLIHSCSFFRLSLVPDCESSYSPKRAAEIAAACASHLHEIAASSGDEGRCRSYSS